MYRHKLIISALTALALSGCGQGSAPESAQQAPANEQAAAAPAAVQVEGGLVSGVKVADSAVMAYKGIPYAAAPVGDLRWKPPQPVVSWEGVRVADSDPDACVQELQRSRLPWSEEYMHQGDASEDCLYLNIWTAASGADEKRPVMVWLHGGGLREGSNAIVTYDGTSFAKKGVVLVGVNYRLGAIGFLALPELTAESEHGASGNYGFLDQVAALKWVQANIARFGGDPDNVTIFGQSAGARSVSMLTQSPLAAGLVDHAIIESGAQRRAPEANSPMDTLAEAEQAGLAIEKAVGATSLAELRAIPAERFVESDIHSPGAIEDGWFWPAKPVPLGVPIIVGFVADDGFVDPEDEKLTVASYKAEAKELYGDQADAYLALYPVDASSNIVAVKLQAMRDKAAVSVNMWADAQSRFSERIYTYFFDRATPWPEHPEFGAHHTSEIPYVFGNLDKLVDRRPEAVDYKVSDMVSSYWVNFARNGDPNGAGLPEWSAYDPAKGTIMHLAADPGMIPPASPEKVAFWKDVFSPAT